MELLNKKDGTPYMVLLAEDKQLNQMMAEKLLDSLGCKVDLVKDGTQAVKKAKEKKYDIIFMDCQMPLLDGYEATGQIREYETKLKDNKKRHTPIIALTAKVMKNDKEKCLNAGMDDYTPKPIKKEEVCRMINKWCGKIIDRKTDW